MKDSYKKSLPQKAGLDDCGPAKATGSTNIRHYRSFHPLTMITAH